MNEPLDDYTQEGQAEGEVEDRPAWLPNQFREPEQLAKSYEHAQAKISQQGQELAALRSRLEDFEQLEAFEQPSEPQQYEGFDEPQYVEPQQREPTASELLGYLAALAEQSQATRVTETASPSLAGVDQLAYSAEQEVAARNPDYAQYRGRVVDLLTELPQLVPASLDRSETVAGIEHALSLARRESALASQTAQDSRLAKMQAQTMSGQGGRMPAPSDDEEHFQKLKTAYRESSYSARMGNL